MLFLASPTAITEQNLLFFKGIYCDDDIEYIVNNCLSILKMDFLWNKIYGFKTQCATLFFY